MEVQDARFDVVLITNYRMLKALRNRSRSFHEVNEKQEIRRSKP